MVGTVLGAKTPEYAAAVRREIDRTVAFGIVTAASLTDRFAATVVVGNQVVAIVERVAACPHPGNWRWLGPRRTGCLGAATT